MGELCCLALERLVELSPKCLRSFQAAWVATMLLTVAHTVLAGVVLARRMAGGAGPRTVGAAERDAGAAFFSQEGTPI